MQALIAVHVLAGSLALIAGFTALYAAKGAPLHRRVGILFVVVMLTMTMSGVVLAAVRGEWPWLNIPAALTTAYLVVTGLTTVRPATRGGRALAIGGIAVALALGMLTLTLGIAAIAGGGKWRGMPAFPFFLFATIATLGLVGDVRAVRSGPPRGASRLARHLWRISTALFVAAMSFFIGQADVIPKPIRIMPLLALPPLAVLVTMVYWLWRVRRRRSLRGITLVAAPEVLREPVL